MRIQSTRLTDPARAARPSRSARPARRATLGTALALTSLFSLVACSSGGGSKSNSGGGSGGGSQGSPDEDIFLLFSGSLNAIDPADPTNAFTFESADITRFDTELDGDFDPATKTLQDVRQRRFVYAKDNDLYTVDLAIERNGGAAIAPVAEHLITFASPILDVELESDYSGSEVASTFVVELASGHQVFREENGGPTTPEPFPGTPEIALGDVSTGAFAGWLALDGGNLYRVNPDLSTDFLQAASEVEELGSLERPYLRIDNSIVSFDPSTNAITDVGFDLTGRTLQMVQAHDGDVFFATSQGGSFAIHRTDADGPVETLVTENLALLGQFTLTDTRLAYAWRTLAPSESILTSVLFDGSDPVELYRGTEGAGIMMAGLFLGGERVFYNRETVGAVVVNADGTNEVLRANGMWMPPVFDDVLYPESRIDIRHLLLLTRVGAGPLELSVVDQSDPSDDLRSLGEVDARFTTFFSVASFRDAGLGMGFEFSGTTGQTDVFFFDAGEADSLIQLTDTPNESEGVIL